MNECNLLSAHFAPANLCGVGDCKWGNMDLSNVFFSCGADQKVDHMCCADERNPDEVRVFSLFSLIEKSTY